jgi:hypothetical protein
VYGGSSPELPPKGREIAELKRRLERYGARQQERGYMYLDYTGDYYRLRWKGAILGAWRNLQCEWLITLLIGSNCLSTFHGIVDSVTLFRQPNENLPPEFES